MAEGSVVISPRGVERLRAGHLWIYRSDVRSAEAEAGAIVRLTDERGRFHGRAFYSDKSQIAIRLITPHDVPVDRAFFTQRFQRAAEFRKRIVENTEAYRLVYGEADLLSSLVVDRYGDYLVIQTLSQGTERQKELFVQILVELFSPKGILERNDPRVRLLEALDQRVGVLYGEIPPEIQAKENGISFVYDLQKGQKTGAFLDQRENHWAARRYVSGEVLDCFSYQGGFALTMAGNCEHVEGIDMAPAAVEAAKRNQALNSISNVHFREGNTFDILKEYDDAGRRFQAVILDPPLSPRTATASPPPIAATRRSICAPSRFSRRAASSSPAPVPTTSPKPFSFRSSRKLQTTPARQSRWSSGEPRPKITLSCLPCPKRTTSSA